MFFIGGFIYTIKAFLLQIVNIMPTVSEGHMWRICADLKVVALHNGLQTEYSSLRASFASTLIMATSGKYDAWIPQCNLSTTSQIIIKKLLPLHIN